MLAFANKRLNVFLIAIGPTPPSFLERAIEVAPKKLEHTADGIFPQSTIRFVNITNACKRFLDVSSNASDVRSLRCCGVKPSGPPLEPFLKDLMLLVISSTETVMLLEQSLSEGAGGNAVWM